MEVLQGREFFRPVPFWTIKQVPWKERLPMRQCFRTMWLKSYLHWY